MIGDDPRTPPRIVGILLAAGAGTRFGGNKLLQPLPDGRRMGVAAAQTLQAALPLSVAIVRTQDRALRAALRDVGLTVLTAPPDSDGMGTNLACAVHALPPVDGIVVALADMPYITSATVRGVARALTAGASLAAPVYRGQRGHPVGFAGHWRTHLQALRGDTGARALLHAHADALVALSCDDPGVVRDIDSRPALTAGL